MLPLNEPSRSSSSSSSWHAQTRSSWSQISCSKWMWTVATVALIVTLLLTFGLLLQPTQLRYLVQPNGDVTPHLLEPSVALPCIPKELPAVAVAVTTSTPPIPPSSTAAASSPPSTPTSLFPPIASDFWVQYRRYATIEPQRTSLESLLLRSADPATICPPSTESMVLIVEWFQYSEATIKSLSGKIMLADHQSLAAGSSRDVNVHMFYGRNLELLAVLQMNLLHHRISSMHVRTETHEEAAYARSKLYDPCNKLVLTVEASSFTQSDGSLGNNRTFGHMLEYANKNLPPGTLFVLTHSDIILGEGFDLLYAATIRTTPPPLDFERTLIFLSRYGLPTSDCFVHRDGVIGPEDQCVKYQGSHDSLIARTPIRTDLIKNVQFSRSQLGSENLFMFKANEAGYQMINPCGNVKTYHSHCSGLRIASNYAVRLNLQQSQTAGGSEI